MESRNNFISLQLAFSYRNLQEKLDYRYRWLKPLFANCNFCR